MFFLGCLLLLLGANPPALAQYGETGYLVIKCMPGVKIFIDNEYIGTTTVDEGDNGGLDLSNITPGRHTLKAVHPGYKTEFFNINVAANDTTILKVLFKKKKLKIERLAEDEVKEFEAKVGTIIVGSFPANASVLLDSENLGLGKLKIENVSIGPHQLELERKGEKLTLSIQVAENKVTEYLGDFEKQAILDLTALKTLKVTNLSKLKETRINKTTTAPKLVTDDNTAMEYSWIDGGCFEMGDVFDVGTSDEKPVHEVCLDGFYLGRYEITQGVWQKIMGDNPSHYKGGADYPVENVSWKDVQAFVRKLNILGEAKYRLPTEAEWEYAARSGGQYLLYATENGELSSELASYKGTTTKPVGSYPPNPAGFYDMSGNVWEWVQDSSSADAYEKHDLYNPVFEDTGGARIIRGGGWFNGTIYLRTTSRGFRPLNHSFSSLGFRLVKLN